MFLGIKGNLGGLAIKVLRYNKCGLFAMDEEVDLQRILFDLLELDCGKLFGIEPKIGSYV